MIVAEAPPLERIYRYPARARWSYIVAAVASGAMAAAAVALLFAPGVGSVERVQLLVFSALFVAVALHAGSVVRTLSVEVRLADAGIGDGRGALVPWSEVARIELRPVRQRLDVYDAAGRRFLSLRPELDSFPAVRDQIVGQMRPRGCVPPCTIPLISPVGGLPVAIACALFALWFGLLRQALLPAAVFAAASSLFALLHLARRRRVVVGTTGVMLKQGGRARPIAYGDISAVHLQARPQPQGAAVHYIVLEREGEESIPIAGVRRGYHEAYQCIESAWRAARGESAR